MKKVKIVVFFARLDFVCICASCRGFSKPKVTVFSPGVIGLVIKKTDRLLLVRKHQHVKMFYLFPVHFCVLCIKLSMMVMVSY